MLKKHWKALALISILFVVIVCITVFVIWPKLLQPTLVGPQGPQGVAGESITGPQGPAGIDGKNADPAEVLVLMQSDPAFLLSVKKELSAPTINNPYMTAYQNTLEYTVSAEQAVPADLLEGFVPVASLVKTDLVLPSGYKVSVPAAPVDVTPWLCFPQDYSNGDQFNLGCKALQDQGKLPWKTPEAGYNDGENWSCDSPDGWCADDIQAENWRVIDGFEICHPAVGCVKDPDGGAAMILTINFHDSDEVWGPRNNSAIYVDSGFIGYGVFWDLSGGTYDVGNGIADLRNHIINSLAYPVTASDNHYRGQCGDSGLCETVTYVVVARVWDRPELGINFSHYELLDYGQWVRP